ncbi:Receptor-like protein 12 [Morella rubra]|uniref:Receptor-like protein 12 n=1 Tax=Morella rubra TaxID=262757 RepID=A0A6A1USJ5_9ROSI|nr:Receptor-like protein 12 [Morella rubra]
MDRGKLTGFVKVKAKSNLFDGDIPQELCLLSSLKILDLSQNNFSGRIPHCLNLSKNDNKDAMTFFEQMEVGMKGTELLYYYLTIDLVHSVDLSNNNLSGEIPEDITTLSLLRILNLSMNHLTGKIPKGIGNLHHLESLDLSRNTLSGSIPQELSSLTFLSHLNLSFNNFSGKIPSGNQLRTLNDPSMYEGNSLLCGPPLSTKCLWEGDDPQAMPIDCVGRRKKIGEEVEAVSFYISMVVGFIVGFWGVCGTLIVKRSWRQAYYQGFDNLKGRMVFFMTEKAIRCLGKIKFDRT